MPKARITGSYEAKRSDEARSNETNPTLVTNKIDEQFTTRKETRFRIYNHASDGKQAFQNLLVADSVC